MIIELKIPSPGESITEVELANWFVENGDVVQKDQEIGEVESEKATLPLIAEKAGKVELLAEVGQTLSIGDIACRIDTSVQPTEKKEETKEKETAEKPVEESDKKTPEKAETTTREKEELQTEKKKVNAHVKVTPVARKMMDEEGLSLDDVINGLRKITSSDIQAIKHIWTSDAGNSFTKKEASREEERNSMSQLRKKISQRLVAVKNETAMLTTFNEADLTAVMEIRKKYQEKFVEKHGVKLGFMSFFTKAVTMALQQYPKVNSYLEGDEIVSPAFCDVGIAVQTEKGLMVPIIRNTETLSLADIEQQILDIAGRARKNRISMDELSGGTFTITNGGIFGSMLSTPILNPPQSGILGMHNIIERPVAINGKVEIRPMMYLALSYDHRVIDGKDSVSFLKAVKEFIETPSAMLFGTNDPEGLLLGL
ncbi:MAG: 2-oxoglutarate dehydrogenase complex dihydrolipoyllysine-residue succinyltransferase [Bacteroidales bacterium]